jgi:hypothetical protein
VLHLHCIGITDKVKVGPNPFTQNIYISVETEREGIATIAIFDAQGKLISQREVQLQKGNNQFIYDGIDHLSGGIYYLQIFNEYMNEHLKLFKEGS